MSKPQVSIKTTILTPFIVSAAAALLSLAGLLDFLDGMAYDTGLQLSPELPARNEIIFIDIDDRAIDYAGTWPIRRDLTADAVIFMAEMGLDVLVFDIEYVDLSPSTVDEELLNNILPENSSSMLNKLEANVSSLLKAAAEGRLNSSELAYYLPDLQDEFRNTEKKLLEAYSDLAANSDEYLGRAGELLSSAFFTVNLAPGVLMNIDPDLKAYYRENISLKNISGDIESIPSATSIMPTIEPVIIRAAGAGFPNVIIDSDGVRRRVDLLQSYDGKIYGQLVFTPLMSVLGNPSVEVSKSRITISGINSRYPDVPETIVIPRTGSGSMLINWPHADYFDSFSHISFGLILETNNLVTSLFRNIRIREDWGYLDEYEGDTPLASLALKLSEERRSAVYGSNRELLQKYSSGIDSFITEIETYLTEELERDFLSRLEEGLKTGALSEEDAQFINNDYPVWRKAVLSQAERLAKNRSYFREALGGKFAVIGNAATGTTDIGVNPFSGEYVNIGTHAAVANTILNAGFIDDRPWYWASTISMLLSFALAFLIRSRGPVLSGLISIVIAAAGVSISLLILINLGIFISPVDLLMNTAVVYAAFTIIKFRAAEAEKGFIKDAFSHYLSEDVISEVLDDPDKLSLGGEQRYLTAMFTDVKGFSTISEQLTPAELVTLLNRYLGEMSDVVLDYKGTIDKYEGDAIIAFFGAPIELKDHALRACSSAILMKRIEQKLNKEFLANNLTPGPLLTRIGINSGDMVVGNMGTERKMNYTMMGNAVNLSARLEGVNKQYGTWILTSEETHSHIGEGFLSRKLDRVRVVGINTPVRLFELVEFRKDASSEEIEIVEIFESGLSAYENRDFSSAVSSFENCLRINENDGPSLKFLALSRDYLENDPGEDWDAVVNLTSK